MIECIKCGNETRTTHLVTAQGEVMLAGTIATDPQPVLAYACTACGYIELYGPQPYEQLQKQERAEARQELPEGLPAGASPPVATSE